MFDRLSIRNIIIPRTYDSHIGKNKIGEDNKEIKYTDTTGILMNSVKIIVNADI